MGCKLNVFDQNDVVEAFDIFESFAKFFGGVLLVAFEKFVISADYACRGFDEPFAVGVFANVF